MIARTPALLSTLIGLMISSLTTALAGEDRPIERILEPRAITEQIHYFYGSLENRTQANLGMNNNVGFVITDEGVVLIDSGPSHHVAQRIEQAVADLTDQPITHVINLGSQDHRWLGNDYFFSQGAEILALERTAATQAEFARQHLDRLTDTLGAATMGGTEPRPAPSPIASDHHAFELGGVRFEMIHAGDAHFPGDILLHLPDQGVVFSGDVVYTERMLGIHPWSNPVEQLKAFETMASWEPEVVVPGHGEATDLATAQQDTGDYLALLVREVGEGLENWETLDEVVTRLADLPQFRHLPHYDDWHRMNINRTYLFMEASF
ncbi:MBL fold metallo-hydrolase [Ectothiorhodospira haloalkaliphila]|uniref:MBL fold metallo-hydrolase n=1 Tax=Ectothiorhodospira haloalkaliphila TaxID=421628 RepID=UPI003B75B982